MSQLFSRASAQKLKKEVVGDVSERGKMLSGKLYNALNELHSTEYYADVEIEKILLKQMEMEVANITKPHLPPEAKGMVYFSPSGASKCARELYFKAKKFKKDEIVSYPYQKRWTRNGSAVHSAVQRDLLYMDKIVKDAPFTVSKTDKGLPKWEENIKTYKIIEHDGSRFGLYGMSDGILTHKEDNTEVGFEFKTKSTTIGAVGNYKMKDAQEGHKTQCTAYALLFDVWEHLIVYESLAKDKWTANEDAKLDLRVFYHKVKDEDVQALLDKYAYITKCVETDTVPPCEPDKCIFCPYKTVCKEIGDISNG